MKYFRPKNRVKFYNTSLYACPEAPERRCGLTRRFEEILLPDGFRCNPPVEIQLTACSGVCSTSFVEGNFVFAADQTSSTPALRFMLAPVVWRRRSVARTSVFG